MRIAVGSIIHETNTFTPLYTTIECFMRRQFLTDEEILSYHLNKKSELGGFLSKVISNNKIIGTISTAAPPSGIVTRDCMQIITNALLQRLQNNVFDGIFLALHGSMCTEDSFDPEGDILEKIRQMHPHAVIGCSLDLHANVSNRMVQNSTFIVGYRTHPHIDQYQTGQRAAKLMLNRSIKDTDHEFISLPLITPGENHSDPMAVLKHEAEILINTPGVLDISYFTGYPWADVPIMGASIYAVKEKNINFIPSKSLAATFWNLRDNFQYPLYDISKIQSLSDSPRSGPVVLNELCDCIYGGSSGDVVTTISYIKQSRFPLSAAAGIIDPTSLKKAFSLGVGKTGDFSIGGNICTAGNPPLRTKATVLSLHNQVHIQNQMYMEDDSFFDEAAVIQADNLHIVLLNHPGRIGGPALFTSLGYNPKNYHVITVKEGLNPFVTYEGICREIIMIRTPGFCPQDLRAEAYHRLTRKIYPIHNDADLHVLDAEKQY